MNRLRGNLARKNTWLRIGVLLLAAHYILPIQLVWCHESDSAPKMELAVNGECLAGSNHDCCADVPGVAAEANDASAPNVSIDKQHGHNHCVGCSDELIHKQPTSLIVAMGRTHDVQAEAGCLFILTQAGFGETALKSETVWREDEHRPPALNSLHALSISLLI